MSDLFHLDLPIILVQPVDYGALLAQVDPESMQEQWGSIFPEEPLPVGPGKPYCATKDIFAVLP